MQKIKWRLPVSINKLSFLDITSSAEMDKFAELLTEHGYNISLNISENFVGFHAHMPVVITSHATPFFYAVTKNIEEQLFSEHIRFASQGEIVITDAGFITVFTDDANSVRIYSQSAIHFVDKVDVFSPHKSVIEDYARTYDSYYLGYEKRYAEVYQNGGTTWEATTPNQSLLNILNQSPEFFLNKKVIDLGCGEGRDSIYLSAAGTEIVGVDISVSALNKARELARKSNVKAKFVETNVLYLNGIPDDYFDTAINMGCLHMIVNSEERMSHLKNVHRILKSGGVFIIDHCQDNWGKGFFSLPGELYNKDKLVVGNVIERRIRTESGEAKIPLEVIPFCEMKADALIAEVCSAGFESQFAVVTETEAFGNSALVVFHKN